jgi:glycosyltransferase involved in cell wall biosynthesis
MFIVYALAISISTAYILLLSGLIIGWKRLSIFKKGSMNPFPVFVSVVIAAKDEENNITNTLDSLANQSLLKNTYEVIIVDDFSTDKTSLIISGFCKTHNNFKHIAFRKHKGKKFALNFAIQQAKGDLIVTTDADCLHHTQWLEIITEYYINSRAKMIIAPVLIKAENWFGQMQALDFLSLMASGAAATGINKPIMNNGANLAFSKAAYLSINDPTNKKISSGDDVFLLLKFKKLFPDSIHFLKSTKATVYTNAKKTFTNYISQRKRWASKSKHYRDFDIIYTAVNVLLINFLLFTCLFATFFSTKLLILFFSILITKSIFDYIFLYKTSVFFEQKSLLKYFLPVQFANIILIPFLAFSGLFSKTKWKGETIKQ